MHNGGDDLNTEAPREAARLRHRDRKRTTRMVVDGAGVRSIALRQREAQSRRSVDVRDEATH